jgi:hypothetical protein
MLTDLGMSATSRPIVEGAPAAPRITAGSTQRFLLACGVASSLVYVAADLLAGLRAPGYSFVSQAISELSAIGAPSRSVWLPLGILYDVLLIAFGVGVWRCAGHKRGLRVAACLLIAVGAIGSFWPPMHPRGSVATLTDTLHVVFATVISFLILLAIAFGATAAGTRFRRYSLATLAALLVFGTLTFRYAPRVDANLPTPWLGLVERLNLGAFLLWVAVLGVVLLRSTAERGSARDRA